MSCLEATRKLLTYFNLKFWILNPDPPTRPSVWDMVSGQEKSKLEGHTDWVKSVAISLDGKTIVSGSDDKTVR